MKALITLLFLGGLGAAGYFGWRYLQNVPAGLQERMPELAQQFMPAPQIKNTPITAPSIARASFLIFTNGFARDFGSTMYLNRSQAAYITEQNPAIILVEQPYTTWKTFFDTLPFKLSETCLFTGNQQTFCNTDFKEIIFYLNGEKVSDLMSRTIHDSDKLLVTYGNKNQPERWQKEYQKIPSPY